MKDIIRVKQKICAENILNYLNSQLDIDKGYPYKTTWGYAFTYLVALILENNELSRKSLKHLLKQDTNDKNYPWEFIVFALKESQYFKFHKINHPATELKSKGTSVLNWRLLNFYNKILFKKNNFINQNFIRILVKIHQKPYGLLMDEFNTRSLQYHNFSLLLLLKIYEKDQQVKWLKKKIQLAMQFSLDNIFSDGTSQFIGRGQEQIFGYGSLIASIKLFEKLLGDNFDNQLNLLVDKIISHQKSNGFIPLVLRSENILENISNYSSDKELGGWYSYNSTFDYLPFLGYCLLQNI